MNEGKQVLRLNHHNVLTSLLPPYSTVHVVSQGFRLLVQDILGEFGEELCDAGAFAGGGSYGCDYVEGLGHLRVWWWVCLELVTGCPGDGSCDLKRRLVG